MNFFFSIRTIRPLIYQTIRYITFNLTQKEIEKKLQRKIFIHVCKSQRIIIIFLYLQTLLCKFLSLIFFFKKLNNINSNQFEIIVNKLNKKKFLKFEKIIELIHALFVLHSITNEKVKKIKIINKPNELDYIENIVIGSGPSGSITANELKKNNLNTLLIEKGNATDIFQNKHPGEEFLNKWKFGGLSAAIGNTNIQYASAECLGGGSEINSGLYHSPSKQFLEKFSKKFKIQNLGKSDLENYENYLKKFLNYNNPESKDNSVNSKFLKGADQLKWKSDFIPKFEKLSEQKNTKNSMTNTILKEYFLNGGKVLLNSNVKLISRKNNYWLIHYNYNNSKKIVKGKNIFLCCGSPYTLYLLNKSKLIKNEINNNLSFHPMIKIIAKYPENLIKENISNFQISEFFPNFIIGHAASEEQFLRISTFNNRKVYDDVILNKNKMIIFHATFSLGEVKLFNIPFLREPFLSHNINSNEFEIIKKGIDKLIQFIFASGADYIYPIFKNIEKINGYHQNYIERVKNISDINFSTVHMLGGVPMGNDEKKCHVDSYGKLINNKAPNIFVNDSSLICDKLLKNPQGTIMALSIRNIKNFISKKNE